MKYIAPAAQTVKNKLKTLIKKLWFKSRRTVKNAEKRIKAHNNGCGAKYTRGRGPVKLVYFESFEIKREAQSREYYIKKLTRNQKLQLISSKSIEEENYEKEINL